MEGSLAPIPVELTKELDHKIIVPLCKYRWGQASHCLKYLMMTFL